MRNWKKFMAAMMAATMMVGSTGVAFAADSTVSPTSGSGTATGEMEGTVVTDVFVVEVPTDDFAYTFKMDPEGLIAGTKGAAYDSSAVFEEGASVFFPNTVEGGTAYSSLSDAITITNKGTTYAKVSIEASIADNTVTDDENNTHTINMVSSDTFSGTGTDLYLAIVDADENVTALTDTTADADAEVVAMIDAAPEDAYELSYNSSGTKYEYTLVSDTTGIEFDTYTFQIKGACNTAADWSELATATPKLNITWKVEQYTPTGTAATFAAGTNVGEITVADGTDDMKIAEIVSVDLLDSWGNAYDGFNAYETYWGDGTYETGKITLAEGFVSVYAANAEKCSGTVTYKTTIGQIVTVDVTDVLLKEVTP